MNSVCAGFVFSLNVAQSMMLSAPRQYRSALVIGTDAFSKIMNWSDRKTCIFFGDGAGAVLLSQTDRDQRIHFRLGSDGRGSRDIQVPAGGTRMPVTAEVLAKRLHSFVMDGPKVWDFAIGTVPGAIQALLAEHGLGGFGPGPRDPASEQPAHDRGGHGRARAADGAGRHHGRVLRKHGGREHSADPEKGLRDGAPPARLARDAVRVRGRTLLGRGPLRLVIIRMDNILISGAASGIGAGLALELARSGQHVVVSDVRLDGAAAVAGMIGASGGSAEAVAMDVTSDESVAVALGSVSRSIDVLVNNAGLQQVARLEEFPMGKWALLVDVMLIGAARLTRAVLPGMRRRGFGRIINIGSIHSLVASPFKSAYVAAKHGLIGFTKAIALETADTDITINTICPSYVKTPLVDKQIAEQARARGLPEAEVVEKIMLQPMPKRAFIGFDELAGVTAFLISPAARNITGQTIVVDGGWTAQ